MTSESVELLICICTLDNAEEIRADLEFTRTVYLHQYSLKT
jgi:hypothetical protein